MAVSAQERRILLTQLTQLAAADVRALWQAAERLSDVEFARFVVDGFPQVVEPWITTASDMAAVWFEESVPGPATVADLVPVERLTKSAQWALGADGTDALSRLTGTTQRAVYDGARDTTLTNVARTDMRWAREARADACAFCKLLASRSKNLYTSKDAAMRVVGRGKAIETNFDDEGKRKSGGQAQGVKTRGSRKIGEKYHDDCRCLPIEVPNPSAYEPPAYVEDWDRVYRKAWDAVPDGTSYDKNGVLKAVLSEWRQIDGSS